MQEIAKKHADKIRFAIVGVANTALDFLILFVLTNTGMDKIVANYISTFSAFIFSFFVNKNFTFKASGGTRLQQLKQFAGFLAVTMVGLWIIQPILIIGVSSALAPLNWNDNLVLFIAKIVATVGSMVWNYIFYSRLVFKKKSSES